MGNFDQRYNYMYMYMYINDQAIPAYFYIKK